MPGSCRSRCREKRGRPSRGRGRPRVGSDAREGRLRAVVSVAYIWSIADRTVDVFRESMMFPISHASRRLAETAQFQFLPDEARSLRNALNRRQCILAGAPPPRGSFAGHPLEHGREVRLRAEADGQRDFGQRHFGVRQQRFRVLDALMQEIFARMVSRRSGTALQSACGTDRRPWRDLTG